MTVLTAERIERPRSFFGRRPQRSASAACDTARKRDGDLGGGLTLDDAIVDVWEGLAARAAVACPLCHGPLRPYATPDVVGGRCDDCGTTLG